MAREARLWQWLSGARSHYRERLHMNRVENSVASGMPDVEGCVDGVGFQIELKSTERGKPGRKIKFKIRAGQVEWHRRRHRCGGRNWFLLQVGSGKGRGVYLIKGNLVDCLKMGVTEQWLSDHCTMTGYRCLDPSPVNVILSIRHDDSHLKV